jgi:hypothetical protein
VTSIVSMKEYLRTTGINAILKQDLTDLFTNGEEGVWFNPSKLSTLFQFSDGSSPVVNSGDPVGRVVDTSGNNLNALQTVSASRPTYYNEPPRLSLDKVDDSIVINIPSGGWVGSMILATDIGTASYGVSIPAGSYTVGGPKFPGNSINNLLIRKGVIGAKELAEYEANFVKKGSKKGYGSQVDFISCWQDMTEITRFPIIDTSSATKLHRTWDGCSGLTSFPLLDTSKVHTFEETWDGCTGLTSFPLIDMSSATHLIATWRNCSELTSFPLLEVSGVTHYDQTWRFCRGLTSFPLLNVSNALEFNFTWLYCTNLINFPANMFDNCLATNFSYAFGYTNLSQASIDGILTSINSNNTSNGTFDQTNGSAPSSVGESAVTALRSRGWAVAVTGGF